MKKINAFTLMELLLCIIIIGFLSTIVFKTLKNPSDDVYDKMSKTKVYKALSIVQQASENIEQQESERCAMNAFMVNAAGSYEYTLLNPSGNNGANTAEVLELYQDYIKFQQVPLNFCNFTTYCNDNEIKGGKILGNIYIGFKIYGNSISNCPDYYLPENDTIISGKGKCWGNLYIKLADKRNQNDIVGKDVFLFGLNEKGIAY